MNSRLVNIRLDGERLRKVKILRESGLALSEVVREAVDERYEKLRATRKRRNVHALIDGLFEKYPDPANLPPRGYDVADRQQAREEILRRLNRSSRSKPRR